VLEQPGGLTGDATDAAVSAAHRDHWGRLLSLLVKEFRQFDLAEDALADAFAAAAAHWRRGVPANPAAWLLTSARRRAIDAVRHDAVLARKLPLLIVEAVPVQPGPEVTVVTSLDGEIPDERLRLLCACAHPGIEVAASTALALRLVLGLSVPQIARLLVVTDTTAAARITRAKKKIAAAGIPFRVPPLAELPDRLARLRLIVYLLFTEGHTSTTGPELVDVDAAEQAIRLGRTLHALAPADAETTSLLALMLLTHARRDSRTDGDGRLVRLAEQDRSRWRSEEIRAATALLERADHRRPGVYAVQAAIAAEHATAATAAATDWLAIALLYDRLAEITDSPVVRLNRAVAQAEAFGPTAGLAALAGLDDELPRHPLVPATRAELLHRLGAAAEAVAQLRRAIALTVNATESRFLRDRLDAWTGQSR
jgi:RNA polymerase sigma-70 factor (ECF subfamily)